MGEKDCLFFWAVEKAPTRDEFTEENKCNLFLGEARAFCWVFQYRYQGVHKRFPASILFANIWKMSKIDTIDGQKIIFFCQLEYSQNISDIPPLPACTFQNQAFFLPSSWSKFYLSWYLLQITILGNFACAIDSVEEVRLVDTVDVWNSVKVLKWKTHLSESKEQFDESFFFGDESSFLQTRGKYLRKRITFAIPWTKRSSEDYHQSYCEKPKQPLEGFGTRNMGPSMEAGTVAEWREVVHHLEFPLPVVPVLPRPVDWKYVYF